jgi:hypothetical protein
MLKKNKKNVDADFFFRGDGKEKKESSGKIKRIEYKQAVCCGMINRI